MATTLEIVTRALRRLRVTGINEDASNEDAAAALEALNGMIQRWAAEGVNAYYSDLALTDTFAFFVPPVDATSEVIDALAYQGVWDANANSPTLASSDGTKGYFYKVTTAGSTTLDDVTSWAANDYAVYSGTEWLKSIDPTRFERAVIDLLALDLTQTYGKEPGAVLVQSARSGWRMIQAAYIKAPLAVLDRAVMQSMLRGYADEDIQQ